MLYQAECVACNTTFFRTRVLLFTAAAVQCLQCYEFYWTSDFLRKVDWQEFFKQKMGELEKGGAPKTDEVPFPMPAIRACDGTKGWLKITRFELFINWTTKISKNYPSSTKDLRDYKDATNKLTELLKGIFNGMPNFELSAGSLGCNKSNDFHLGSSLCLKPD